MRRPRIPLYGQILLWFFLNLALVAAVLALVLKLQFQLDLGAILTGRTTDQFKAVAEVLSADLRDAPRSEWEEILVRYDEAYGVSFLLAFPGGTDVMAGEGRSLPKNLLERARRDFPPRNSGPRRGPPGGRPGPDGEPRRPGPPGNGPLRGLQRPPFSDGGPEADRRPPRGPGPPGEDPPPPRPEGGQLDDDERTRLVRVFYVGPGGEPTRYWAAAMVSLGSREHRHPPDGMLVASSATLGGNGIFFDWRPWIWAVLVILVVSALIWLPFVGRVTRRLRRLTSAAESISAGNFEVEVASKRGDELGRLSRAVQRMASRLDDYMAGQKRFLGDIAHELCSPLARLRMAVGVLESKLPKEDHGHLESLHEEAEELSQLVNELLDFSRASIAPGSLPQHEVDLAELLEEVAEREGRGSVFKIEVEPGLCVETNRDLLRRALGNVVRNANRYAGEAGPIELAARRRGEEIAIEVRDQGPGIPEEWLERVFEPFSRPERARTREGGGAGLGLAIAKTCAEGLGGRIGAQNRDGGGLTVELVLRIMLNASER